MQTQIKLASISQLDERSNLNSSMSSGGYHKPMKAIDPMGSYDPEVYERQKKLFEIRDKIRAKHIESPRTPTPRTPRTQELLGELDKFRTKTPATFKPLYD